MDSHVDSPIQKAILLSQTAKSTGARLQQPNSEAHEADDRCFQVSLARQLMLAHPAASDSANISTTCPNVSAAKRVCSCPIDNHQLHCIVCKSGGGVDQRHSALARCLADLVTTPTGAKVYIEQTIPGLPREPQPGAQPEGARMDVVFNLRGHTYFFDTAMVTPFSSNAGLISAASARPSHTAKREEKKKFDRYPRIKPLDDQATTHKSSSNTFTATRTTDHIAQQHLQTTALGRHHVTPGACPSPHPTRVPPLFALFTAVHFTFCCLAPISPLHGCSSSVAAIDTLGEASRLCCPMVY